MILEILAGAAAVGVTVSGWIVAYRERGKANEAAERSRIAEVARDAARQHGDDDKNKRAAAESELRVERVNVDRLTHEVARLAREKRDLLERLATSGVPVGDVVVDDALDRLYPDEDRRETDRGPNPGPGGDHDDVSGDPSVPSTEATTLRLPR